MIPLPLNPWQIVTSCFLLLLPLTAPAQLSEQTGIISPISSSGDYTFVSTVSTKDTQAPQIFTALNASTGFKIGNLPALTLSTKASGIIVASEADLADGSITPQWQIKATSPNTVNFTDIALVPDSNLVVVCGTFVDTITFDSESATLALSLNLITGNDVPALYSSGNSGFFALFDRETGGWKSAHITSSVLPASITSADASSVLITGQGVLAARYLISDGSLSWKTLPQNAGDSPKEISTIPGGTLAVLVENNTTPGDEGISLLSLDPASGAEIWTHKFGDAGTNTSGGLEVASNGRIHLAFHSENGGSDVQPEGSAIYSASVTSGGSVEWIRPIAFQNTGTGNNGDYIQNSCISTDSNGSTWLACFGLGNWQMGDFSQINLRESNVYVKIDAAGKVTESLSKYLVDPLTGTTVGRTYAITAAGDGHFFAIGDYENTSFLASFRIIPGQKLYSIYPIAKTNGTYNYRQIAATLRGVGASSYIEIGEETSSSQIPSISAWLVDAQFDTLSGNAFKNKIAIELESRMNTSGFTENASESLRLIGESLADGTTYAYPDTETPVRLYLIDTSVANPGDWIGQSPNLTLEETVLIRGNGDPNTSTTFKHGTQMLSVIAGKTTGVSPGTPIGVISYDVYPEEGSTTASHIAVAVYRAAAHYQDSGKTTPSAICIASSSDAPASSHTLRSAVEYANEQGLTVIVSAGNQGKDASAYIPAAYGDIEGVISTGAIDSSSTRITSSNWGSCVDIYSPGQDILTIDDISSETFLPMTGTSPAAAFTTGIVLTELSANGTDTPAKIEETLEKSAKDFSGLPTLRATVALPDESLKSDPDYSASGNGADQAKAEEGAEGTSPARLLSFSSTTPPAGADIPDSDNDGISDYLETFHGSSPTESSSISPAPTITPSGSGNILFKFRIDPDLFDPENPLTLLNGQNWGIECSKSMTKWEIPTGTLTLSTDGDGVTWLTASFPWEETSCFLRLIVTEPTSTP